MSDQYLLGLTDANGLTSLFQQFVNLGWWNLVAAGASDKRSYFVLIVRQRSRRQSNFSQQGTAGGVQRRTKVAVEFREEAVD